MKKVKRDKIAKALGADRVLDPVAMALENRQLRSAFNQAKKKMLEMRQELDEHKRLFEKQHDRSRDADILWREAYGKPDTSPDLGTLLQWLIDRGDRWQALVIAAKDMDNNFNGHRYNKADCVCGHSSDGHENVDDGPCRTCDCESYREGEPSGDEMRWKALRKALERLDAFYEGYKF